MKITITNQRIYRRAIGLPGYTTITIDPLETVTFDDDTLANRGFYDKLASKSNDLKVLINDVVADVNEVVPVLPPYVDKAPEGFEDKGDDESDPKSDDPQTEPTFSGKLIPVDDKGTNLLVDSVPYTNLKVGEAVKSPSIEGYTAAQESIPVPADGGNLTAKYTLNTGVLSLQLTPTKLTNVAGTDGSGKITAALTAPAALPDKSLSVSSDSGITYVDNKDNTYTVSWKSTVKDGDYKVTVSSVYDTSVSAISTITLTPALPDDSDVTLVAGDSKISASIKTLGKNAKGVNLYKDGSTKPSLVLDDKTTSGTISSLTNDTKVTIVAKSFNDAGESKGVSSDVTPKAVPTEDPAAK